MKMRPTITMDYLDYQAERDAALETSRRNIIALLELALEPRDNPDYSKQITLYNRAENLTVQRIGALVDALRVRALKPG